MKIPSELRWKASDTLGSGGQASVVCVTDGTGEIEGMYALKGLTSGNPQKAYERFSREIEAIKKLDHPNIIKIVDHSNPEDGFQFYVMEYIEGAKSLKKLITEGLNPFYSNPSAALDLFYQLSSAIEAWRGARIVHRDLSPANILVASDLSIKVIDFGICQAEGEETITLIDEGVGSRNYTAPECEAGTGGEATIAADFYSAGKVLWTAITNEMAFAREAPVYKSKSMSVMFPKQPLLWHVQHIFENTIREKISDRFSNGDFACQFTLHVRRLVTGGFMPLLDMQVNMLCPHCGWGSLANVPAARAALGVPNLSKRNIEYLRCNYCGICLAFDADVMAGRLRALNDLS